MKTTFTFSDYDGHTVTIPLSMVEQIHRSSGRVHDDGKVVLTSGRAIAFGPGNYPAQLEAALAEYLEGPTY